MGDSQNNLVISPVWTLVSHTGFIIAVSLLVCAGWLTLKYRQREGDHSAIDIAVGHRGDFFKLFSRMSIFTIACTVSSAYMISGESTMDYVFERIPNYYILYVFLFVAYDMFWEIVGQFNGVGRH